MKINHSRLASPRSVTTLVSAHLSGRHTPSLPGSPETRMSKIARSESSCQSAAGKSGCITITPFAFRAIRTLVVAPGVKIAQQLHDNFDPAHPDIFYIKCGV